MSLIKEIDYGTPASTSEKTVTLTIDGQSVTVPEGTSIMRAAMEIGDGNPQTLRDRQHQVLRLVPPVPRRDRRPQRRARLLHDAGRAGHFRAYQTPRLQAIRRGVMELYISDHPLDCLTCAGEWRLRVAGNGRRGRPARRALRL